MMLLGFAHAWFWCVERSRKAHNWSQPPFDSDTDLMQGSPRSYPRRCGLRTFKKVVVSCLRRYDEEIMNDGAFYNKDEERAS